VKEAEGANSCLGLFPTLYRKVTIRVQEGIEGGRFQDGPRMARLDTVFANRYLEAYAAFRSGQPCSACWRVAFDAAARWRPTVLQHLRLGMAAHIQFDLGIAAATVAPGPSLAGLGSDFMAINAVLGELVGEVQEALDLAGGDLDERLARFGMDATRDGAWRFAQELAALVAGPGACVPLADGPDRSGKPRRRPSVSLRAEGFPLAERAASW
jgi:hypothetical protein